jgi:hypothetical protein
VPPADGSRPGLYFINLRDTFDRPKFGLRTLTHHEATPGHHLQGALALESTQIPLIRRHAYYSAFGEGWALYAEQLADELGIYEGRPLERAGMLQSFLFRATRLVVDTGIHARRWSREQATDYFIRTTGIARGRSQNEIDRYTAWPGQATSYKVGHITWLRLREEARRRQGANFDLKRFHEVLLLGAMPLTVLERASPRGRRRDRGQLSILPGTGRWPAKPDGGGSSEPCGGETPSTSALRAAVPLPVPGRIAVDRAAGPRRLCDGPLVRPKRNRPPPRRRGPRHHHPRRLGHRPYQGPYRRRRRVRNDLRAGRGRLQSHRDQLSRPARPPRRSGGE